MRSAYSAMWGSCVTTTIVRRRSRVAAEETHDLGADCVSRLPVGSSARSSDGPLRARAPIATRLLLPAGELARHVLLAAVQTDGASSSRRAGAARRKARWHRSWGAPRSQRRAWRAEQVEVRETSRSGRCGSAARWNRTSVDTLDVAPGDRMPGVGLKVETPSGQPVDFRSPTPRRRQTNFAGADVRRERRRAAPAPRRRRVVDLPHSP